MPRALEDQPPERLGGSEPDPDQLAFNFSLSSSQESHGDFAVLRQLVVRTLHEQGFTLDNFKITPPDPSDKNFLRQLHATAVRHRIANSRKSLARIEDKLLSRLASGREVVSSRISPYLKLVEPGTNDELLFRYACLHWSIPVSSGYGRRIRFLVIDQENEKLIGLFGLGDPVFSLRPRDEWIGWTKELRKQRLSHVMEAFVIGAVPPYSQLLCGKLVALMAASNEVRNKFSQKYGGQESIINKVCSTGELALVTTASALGRSSLYNRLSYRDRLIYHRVGFTQGSGEFHFSNGLYAALSRVAHKYCSPTAKHKNWGNGFRSRREVIKKALAVLDLPTEWLYHGVKREIFAVPLAGNTASFLRGEDSELEWYDTSAEALVEFFKGRWLIPRSTRDQSFQSWDPESWRLWT